MFQIFATSLILYLHLSKYSTYTTVVHFFNDFLNIKFKYSNVTYLTDKQFIYFVKYT